MTCWQVETQVGKLKHGLARQQEVRLSFPGNIICTCHTNAMRRILIRDHLRCRPRLPLPRGKASVNLAILRLPCPVSKCIRSRTCEPLHHAASHSASPASLPPSESWVCRSVPPLGETSCVPQAALPTPLATSSCIRTSTMRATHAASGHFRMVSWPHSCSGSAKTVTPWM